MNTIARAWHAAVHHTRKNSHLAFFTRSLARYAVPDACARRSLTALLGEYDVLTEEEQQYVRQRVDYYCKFADAIALPADAPMLRDFRYRSRETYVHDYVNSTYFFDAEEFTRFFPKHYRWAYNPGDINYLFPVPEITKSRPLGPGNANNILLNLDKVRHFLFVHDPFAWEEKECRVIFRGDITGKPRRRRFIDMWQDNPICDLQAGGGMPIYEHLRYRYIMALEGNDVASNLKWVMSSNSVAVMPRPTCETWYMEGLLRPNYHYIEIAADYHDLPERIAYYEAHPNEAKAIVEHAHQWVAQFQDKKREQLISLMVLDKYFRLTGQSDKGPRRYIVRDNVTLNGVQQLNAQGKARHDVVRTLLEAGYTLRDIDNRRYSWGKDRKKHHFPAFTAMIANRQARQFVSGVQAGDTVLIQDFQLPHMQRIATGCKRKGAKVVFLVHDVQSIRFRLTQKRIDREIAQLRNASLLLVHTPAMQKALKNLGIDTHMRVLTLFDYYAADPMADISDILKRKYKVAFAGNLAKSEFLKQLPAGTGIQYRLYGILGKLVLPETDSIVYEGVFRPESTARLRAGWGLVWDGDSADTCAGELGEYLRYNASHKISLYLAAGLPLIVWTQSALAEWVQQQHVGIVVPSLDTVAGRIADLSDDEYRQMTVRARDIGGQLRQGQFLKKCLDAF